jgi:hypothetical protein
MQEFSGLHGLRDEWYYLRDGGSKTQSPRLMPGDLRTISSY